MGRKIIFKGQKYILIGETDGPVTKEEDYIHGRPSYAHLYPNGELNRLGEVIGNVDDIEFGEFVSLKLADDAWSGLFDWMLNQS